jgi:benzoyl-CoA reductase/2-hydroxyglutaryl-CoA dehydratase subunit BcrC/BadD/HgdB
MYKIQTTGLLKELMQNYFDELKNGNKIAWCSSAGPSELLRAFGFKVYFPENHGALLGATRTAGDYIPVATKLGYSSEICSYLTSDIGTYLSKSSPLLTRYGFKEIPRPDIIVYNTNQCREIQDWFSFYGNEFNCPVVGIKPPRYLNEITKSDIEDVVIQFKNIIPDCEKVSGKKFDLDSFKQTIKHSKEAALLWKQVLETAKESPPPISFFDGTIHMGPIVVLRGTPEATHYYRVLLNELNENIKNGLGIMDSEMCRLYWEGMPIWGKLKYLSNLFINNNAAVVASTYCNSWAFDDFDEDNPFESSALAYTQIFINRSENVKLEMLKSLIENFRIDGVIFHEAKTCFNNSNSSFGMPLRLKEQTGVETLIIEGDLCDLRFFSEGQTTTKIETFIEQIT